MALEANVSDVYVWARKHYPDLSDHQVRVDMLLERVKFFWPGLFFNPGDSVLSHSRIQQNFFVSPFLIVLPVGKKRPSIRSFSSCLSWIVSFLQWKFVQLKVEETNKDLLVFKLFLSELLQWCMKVEGLKGTR